tara:strand:- start:429 stop:875 length:447 start_codon:yes stop_codon:yes gene_type:complete
MSTIVTDTITGKSTATTVTIGSTPVVSASANSMTIRGEGSNQTSIQQGLAKSWANALGNATSINDSLNVASLTDTNTGNAQFNLTNNMSGTEFSFTVGHQYTTTSGTGAFFSNPITGSSSHYQIQHYQNGSIADPQKYSGLAIHGDLS